METPDFPHTLQRIPRKCLQNQGFWTQIGLGRTQSTPARLPHGISEATGRVRWQAAPHNTHGSAVPRGHGYECRQPRNQLHGVGIDRGPGCTPSDRRPTLSPRGAPRVAAETNSMTQ
eukprot:gene25744-biopygen4526